MSKWAGKGRKSIGSCQNFSELGERRRLVTALTFVKHSLCTRLGAKCVVNVHYFSVSPALQRQLIKTQSWRVQSWHLNPGSLSQILGTKLQSSKHLSCSLVTKTANPKTHLSTLCWQFGALCPKKAMKINSPLTSRARPSIRHPEAPVPSITLHVSASSPPPAAVASLSRLGRFSSWGRHMGPGRRALNHGGNQKAPLPRASSPFLFLLPPSSLSHPQKW